LRKMMYYGLWETENYWQIWFTNNITIGISLNFRNTLFIKKYRPVLRTPLLRRGIKKLFS
jgi:hypothetical protein